LKQRRVILLGLSVEAGGWLNLLISFDAIFLVVAFITFEYVLEE